MRVDNLRFVIAGVHRTDLRGRWLVFQLSALDARYGEPLTAYACSPTAFFERSGANPE